MNERIKELAKQTMWTKTDYSQENELYSFSRDELGKFAELILTEVTDILATYRMKAIFLDGFEYNCQHPIYAIQKHFGIKS